jgi:hypothetical protein
MSTLTEPDWKWYVGYSDEEYSSGPYQTRAEAVYIAKEEYEGGYIVEGYKEPIDLAKHFEADWFLENFEDNNYELAGPDDPLIQITKDQQTDLEAMVRQAIRDWQQKHNLVFMPWTFTETRNEDYIDGEMGNS